MYEQRITQMSRDMEQVVASFSEEIKTLRTGRASATLVEDVLVSYYGTPTPLKHIASIAAPDPKMIVISPWDKSILSEVEQAIRTADLGISPVNDGTVVRVSIPPMTEDRRKELARKLHQMAEEVRVALRTIRRDAWEEIQGMEKQGKITEDDRYAAEKEVNTVIEEFHAKIESEVQAKDKEIMTV